MPRAHDGLVVDRAKLALVPGTVVGREVLDDEAGDGHFRMLDRLELRADLAAGLLHE